MLFEEQIALLKKFKFNDDIQITVDRLQLIVKFNF
jgi:hypothetical protein